MIRCANGHLIRRLSFSKPASLSGKMRNKFGLFASMFAISFFFFLQSHCFANSGMCENTVSRAVNNMMMNISCLICLLFTERTARNARGRRMTSPRQTKWPDRLRTHLLIAHIPDVDPSLISWFKLFLCLHKFYWSAPYKADKSDCRRKSARGRRRKKRLTPHGGDH